MKNKTNKDVAAFRLYDGAQLFINDTKMVIDGPVIHAEASKAVITNSSLMNSEAYRLLNNLELEVQKLQGQVPEKIIEELMMKIESLRKTDKGSFSQKYTELVSTAADHATVMAAITPFLGPLSTLFG